MREFLAAQGTVWDQLCKSFYGDEGLINHLLKANPKLRHTVKFDVPTLINVPDKPEGIKPPSSLPPWKQAG